MIYKIYRFIWFMLQVVFFLGWLLALASMLIQNTGLHEFCAYWANWFILVPFSVGIIYLIGIIIVDYINN